MSAADLPAWDGDLTGPGALADPYPLYARLRAAGPAVRLTRHGVIALTGYAQVHSVLHAGEVLRPQPVAAAADGAARLVPPRLPDGLLAGDDGWDLLVRIRARAEEATGRHIAGADRPDVAALARELMADLLVDVLGLPPAERARALEAAAGETRAGTASMAPTMLRTLAPLLPQVPARGGSVRAALLGDSRGRYAPDGILPALESQVIPALETAAHAAVHTIALFAQRPALFGRLRSARDKAENCLHETLRWQPPVHTGVHRLTSSLSLAGPAAAAAGTTVWLLYACAGRDPAHFGPTAHLYQPERPHARGHLLLGTRPQAPGYRLATAFGRTLIAALARHCTALELHGRPTVHTTAALRGYTRLPLHVTPDGRVMRAHRRSFRTTAG